MSKLLLCLVLSLTIVPSVFAQSAFHVFPQVADGFSGPLTYQSSLMVRSASDSAVDCTLRFYGLRVTTLLLRRGTLIGPNSVFTLTFGGNNAWAYVTTSGQQALVTGYATLTCTGPVFAQMLYSLYNGNTKVGEAAVFSTDEEPRSQLIADQTESAHLGIAIANNTDAPHDYMITAFDTDGTMIGTTIVRIGPRLSLPRFLDELLPASANTLASATIRATDASSFSTIGLRFTGPVFATISPTR